MRLSGMIFWGAMLALAGCAAAPVEQADAMSLRGPGPVADAAMRWDSRPGSDAWTRATLAALDRHGVQIIHSVPRDVNGFCPAYADKGVGERKAFWAGLLSALAKHESTYNPKASGGGGKWLGLMQIAPATWRHYGCTGEIMNGADNMACAVRIMARQVGRDNAVAGGDGAWRGVARDWAPMRNARKGSDIAAWTRKQSYCTEG